MILKTKEDFPKDWRNLKLGIYLDSKSISIYNYLSKESITVNSENYSNLNTEIFTENTFIGCNLQTIAFSLYQEFKVIIKPIFDVLLMSQIFQFPVELQDDVSIYNSINPSNKKEYYSNGELSCIPVLIMIFYKDRIKSLSKIFDIEKNFLEVAIQIRISGIRCDLNSYKEVFDILESNYNETQTNFDKKYQVNCRPTSNLDIGSLISRPDFQFKGFRLTKSGVSCSTENLKIYKTETNDIKSKELIDDILNLKKIFSQYNLSKKYEMFLDTENVMHPTIKQIGEKGTSRVYSSEPSIQQYPHIIRNTFIPRDGYKFVFFDWKGAEFYIACYFSKCELGLNWFKEGIDIHTEISKRLLGKDKITPEERKVSKVVTFATIFGSEGCSVSDALCVSKEEGFKLVESFFNIFPEIKIFRNNIIKFCKDTGYTKTMLGRPRLLPEIKSSNQYIVSGAERQAFNTAIQATCADLFKISAHKVSKYSNEGVSFKFGVFDSLLLEVPKSMEESHIISIINDLSDFSNIFKDFKFNYDYSIGESWGECCDKM